MGAHNNAQSLLTLGVFDATLVWFFCRSEAMFVPPREDDSLVCRFRQTWGLRARHTIACGWRSGGLTDAISAQGVRRERTQDSQGRWSRADIRTALGGARGFLAWPNS